MAAAPIRRFGEALTDDRLSRGRYCPHSNESGRTRPGQRKRPGGFPPGPRELRFRGLGVPSD